MTAKMERAITALLTHATKTEAAQAAGISMVTLRKYMKDPEFQVEYCKAVHEVIADATRRAQQALRPAIATLADIATGKIDGNMVRISACRSILEYGLKLTEISDILSVLEGG